MMIDKSKIKAVIFDMDGVILDSETLYKHNNKIFFSSLGMDVSDEMYNTFIGLSSTKMWEKLKSTFDLPNDILYYKDLEKEEKYQLLSRTDLFAHDALETLLSHLKVNDINIGLASMSMKKNIILVIEKLKIESYFQVIKSGEDVTNGKPHPEIFIKTAEELGISTESCLVIEDSKNGVAAAKAANMQCIGFINVGSGNQDLSLADWVVNGYDEVVIKLQEP